MITHLHIENYALIEHLDLDLAEGFSVITGETGAGKSILLGALGLLLGKRADSRSLKAGAQKCILEADFHIRNPRLQQLFDEAELDFDGSNILVRRELTASGKSRAFVNDTPVPLTFLSELGNYLIDIHSQHQNLLLNREDFQLSVLDVVADNSMLLAQYQTQFHVWKAATQELRREQEELARQQDDQDYLQFQFAKLQEAKLREGEQEELEQEQRTLEHAEDIRNTLYQSATTLNDDDRGAILLVRQAARQINNITGVFPPAQEFSERLESCYLELKDLGESIEDALSDIDIQPGRLEWVNDRLSEIYALQQKHHVDTVAELIQLQTEMGRKLDAIENRDETLRQLRQAVDDAHKKLTALGEQLRQKRTESAQTLERQMKEHLQALGMPKVRFAVDIQPTTACEAHGMDKVQFLFSANQGTPLQNIAQIASGGEIARVMLTIKAILAQKTEMPTIIFDEIDTGVSGSIAERMAQMMRQMTAAENRQVISITHLPQIAALGNRHFRVYKEDAGDTTLSHIAPLNEAEREEAIAHMLSGTNLTEAAMNNARELLANGKR